MPKEQVAFVSISNLLSHLYNFGYEKVQLLVKAGFTESAIRNYEMSRLVSAHVFSISIAPRYR